MTLKVALSLEEYLEIHLIKVRKEINCPIQTVITQKLRNFFKAIQQYNTTGVKFVAKSAKSGFYSCNVL